MERETPAPGYLEIHGYVVDDPREPMWKTSWTRCNPCLTWGKSGAEEGDLLAILDLFEHTRPTNELLGNLKRPPYSPVVMPYDALFVDEVDRLLLDIAPPIRGISNPVYLKVRPEICQEASRRPTR